VEQDCLLWDGLQRLLQVSSIPTTMLFDKQGHVASRMNGFLPETFVGQLTERIESALDYRSGNEGSGHSLLVTDVAHALACRVATLGDTCLSEERSHECERCTLKRAPHLRRRIDHIKFRRRIDYIT